MKYLSKEQIISLHHDLIKTSGGILGIRDDGMLDSAINTPLQCFDGKELYPSIIEKATRLAFGLINNHPFIDGNKRIGTHAFLIFLALNDIYLEYSDKDLINIIFSVASSKSTEKDLYEWIKSHQA